MSNKIQVFDLFNASNISLTSNGFKKEGESAKYVCKITDATIVFVGDNSKSARSPMLPLFSWVTTRSSKQTRRNCSTLSPLHCPRSNRKSSKESSMRRRERVTRTVNTMARSSSKWNWVRTRRSWITTRNPFRSIYEMCPVRIFANTRMQRSILW